MNWDDLRLLLALSRGGSFSAAGRALGITHTTASRRLKRCERDLGTLLFDRTPQGLRPTVAGRALLRDAEEIEGRILLLQGRVSGYSRRLKGPLTVTTMPMLLQASAGVFAGFCQAFPKIELSLDTSDSLRSLHRREAEVALRLSPGPPEGLIGRRVGRPCFAVFAHPSVVARIGAQAPLAAFPWLGLLGPEARWFASWLAEHAPGATVHAQVTPDSSAIAALVQAAVGVCLMPTWQGEAMNLVQIGPSQASQNTAVWLLTHPDLRSNARVRAFLDFMADALPKHAAWAAEPPIPHGEAALGR